VTFIDRQNREVVSESFLTGRLADFVRANMFATWAGHQRPVFAARPHSPTNSPSRLFSNPGVLLVYLLVAEPILTATVGTLPRNIVAGHAPQILLHANLADHKAAAATPAEADLF
jgi:hypothetical protein